MKQSILKFALTGMVIIFISGCAMLAPKASAPPVMTAEQVAQQQAARSLDDALALYEKGHYQHAENRLLSENIWQGSKQTQVTALKHLAFIYCITEREQMCRHAFERAMHINSYFVLSTAEATHPLWGPQYQLARSGKKN